MSDRKQSIVFFPGIGFSSSVWSVVADELKHEEIIFIDYPIEFNSSDPKSLSEKIIASIASKIPEDSILIAWSMGGLFAIELAFHYPDKCGQLILTASSPRFLIGEHWPGIEKENADNLMTQVSCNFEQAEKEFLQWVQYPSAEYVIRQYLQKQWLQLSPETFSSYLNLIIDLDVRESFSAIEQSITVLLGNRDPIVPIPARDAISHLNKNANVIEIEGAGHSLFLTHREYFSQLIISKIEPNE